MVRTDHICSSPRRVSRLQTFGPIPELQAGSIRVELHSLTTEDFIRILKEPKSAL